MITDRRLQKFAQVASNRQHMTVILENVHDRHNIGAVMRTCDSVGIQELYVLYTEKRLQEKHLQDVKSTSTGVRKWLHVHFHTDIADCFKAVKEKYDTVLATHLDEESKSLHDLDLTGKVALLFGNEHDGISKEAISHADGNFVIPQYGMVGSLNISVACAVSLYEASRQRAAAGLYTGEPDPEALEARPDAQAIYTHYVDQHDKRYQR